MGKHNKVQGPVMGKMITGTVLAAGLGAGLFGAVGTAQAAPGVSISRDGKEAKGIGDRSATGATAESSAGNKAVAISIKGPSHASSVGGGTGNQATAIDGVARVDQGNNNRVVGVKGSAVVSEGDDNDLVAVGGSATAKGDGNRVRSYASTVDTAEESSQFVVALCGKSVVKARSENVTVSGDCGTM